jgi:hypothetical protein
VSYPPVFPSVSNFSLGGYTADNKALQQESWDILRTLSSTAGAKMGWEELHRYHNQLWYKPDARRKVLLVGNSHSKDLFNVFWFSARVAKNFQIAFYGTQIRELNDPAARIFSSPNYRAADIVVIVSRYSKEDVDALPTILDKMSKDKKSVVVVENIFPFPQFGNFNLADKEIFAFMRSYPDYKDRLLQLQTVVNRSYFEEYRDGAAENWTERLNERIRTIAKKNDVKVLDRMDYVCDRAGLLWVGVPALEEPSSKPPHPAIWFMGRAMLGASRALVAVLGRLLRPVKAHNKTRHNGILHGRTRPATTAEA